MFAVAEAIAEHLATLPALSGWDIRRDGDGKSRDPVPAVDIRMEGAGIASGNSVSTQLAPRWGVYLVVERGVGDTAQLDAAFNAVLEALINFAPGEQSGRTWTPLNPIGVPTPDFTDSGLTAYGIIFETSAIYSGKN